MARYWRGAYIRNDGTAVRGHWVNGRDARTGSAQAPIPSHARPRSSKRSRKTAAVITATAVIAVGAVTFTVTRSGSAGVDSNVSAQASVDVSQAVSELPKLRYAGKILQNGASDSSQNCSQNSTGDVKNFFAKNSCKEYAVTSMVLHNQKISTQAVISWVVMATSGLTTQYKNLVDQLHKGNPPGQSTVFNGSCYASGQNGDSAWVAQVQPTEDIAADRQILQAVAPANLSSDYLVIHCVR